MKSSVELFQQVVNSNETSKGKNHRSTIRAKYNLAEAHRSAGNLGEAISLYGEILDWFAEHPDESRPDPLAVKLSLANALISFNQPNKAIPLLEEVWQHRSNSLGENHLDTISARQRLATALQNSNDPANAEQHHAAVIDSYHILQAESAAQEGEESLESIRLLLKLGDAQQSASFNEDATETYQRAFILSADHHGKAHDDTLDAMSKLATILHEQKRTDEALPLLEQLYSLRLKNQGVTALETVQTLGRLTRLRHEIVPASVIESVPLWETLSHSLRQENIDNLANSTLMAMGHGLAYSSEACLELEAYPEAERLAREAIHWREHTSPEAWYTFFSKCVLAHAISKQGDFQTATELFNSSLPELSSRFGETSPRYSFQTTAWVIDHYRAVGQFGQSGQIGDNHARVTGIQSCLEFSGTSSCLDLETLTLDPQRGVTLEAWVRPTDFSKADRWGDEFLFAQTGEEFRTWINLRITSNAHWATQVEPRKSGNGAWISTADQDHHEFKHIAAVISTEKASMYVNGTLIGSHGISNGLLTDEWKIRIGGHHERRFQGLIDEVRISNTLRYTEDFVPDREFESDDDTLALFHFDANPFGILVDHSRFQRHLLARSPFVLLQTPKPDAKPETLEPFMAKYLSSLKQVDLLALPIPESYTLE